MFTNGQKVVVREVFDPKLGDLRGYRATYKTVPAPESFTFREERSQEGVVIPGIRELFPLSSFRLEPESVPSAVRKNGDEGESPKTALEVFSNLLQEGKTALVGGVSLLGSDMAICRCVGIYKVANDTSGNPDHLEGWSFWENHPEESFQGLKFENQVTERISLPTLMGYIACEVDPRVVSSSASEDEIRDIVGYALQFCADG